MSFVTNKSLGWGLTGRNMNNSIHDLFLHVLFYQKERLSIIGGPNGKKQTYNVCGTLLDCQTCSPFFLWTGGRAADGGGRVARHPFANMALARVIIGESIHINHLA